MQVKALACELPAERDLPFSRFSHADITREAVQRGIVAAISGATVWRWLSADAIKPWPTGVGFSRVTPNSKPRPQWSWTSTKASTKANRWDRMIT